MMDLDEITRILNLMREHELAEFELERDQVKLRLRKHTPPNWSASPPPPALYAPPAAGGATPQAGPPPSPVLAPVGEDLDLAIVKSPIVGTFYSASEPGAKPFVEVGQRVRQGEVLCIIEAMKLMNEINAECDGELVKVYVENGQAVQYGERLFAIRPATT
jgi:acetyl-CoA carboxylase biotin carboxyl carrier protein